MRLRPTLLAVVPAAARVASAQTVRGAVVESGGTRPAVGGLVTLRVGLAPMERAGLSSGTCGIVVLWTR